MISSIILRNSTDGSSCTASPSTERVAILEYQWNYQFVWYPICLPVCWECIMRLLLMTFQVMASEEMIASKGFTDLYYFCSVPASPFP